MTTHDKTSVELMVFVLAMMPLTYYIYFINRNVGFKRLAHPVIVIVSAAVFGFLWSQTVNSSLERTLVPVFVVVVIIVNLWSIRFCSACGMVVYDFPLTPRAQNCFRCGSRLSEKAPAVLRPPTTPPRWEAISKESIVFQDKKASGYSEATWTTRLGGANRCLKLIVTSTFLQVTGVFPFSMITSAFDLEHTIPLGSITSVVTTGQRSKKAVELSFLDQNGRSHRLVLMPNNLPEFLKAIGHAEAEMPN